MKISINTDPSLRDTEVVINAPELTPEIESLIAALNIIDRRLTVIKNGETYMIGIDKIAYIETVDRKTFVYTDGDCYESKLKLYEMEDRLCSGGFLRVSKSCIVRLRYIRSIRSEPERRLRLTLENGEQLIVSRQYSDELKQKLGVL